MSDLLEQAVNLLRLSPMQADFARRTYQTIRRGRIDEQVGLTCLQGEGALGKTRAYNIAVHVALTELRREGHPYRVLVVTSTTHLRDESAIEQGYIGKALAQLCGNTLSIGTVRGPQDFIDIEAAHRIAKNHRSEAVRSVAAFLAAQPEGTEFAKARQDYEDQIGSWPRNMPQAEIVLRYGNNMMAQQNRSARNADVLFATQAKMLKSIFGRRAPMQAFSELLGIADLRTVIVDEADRLIPLGEQMTRQALYMRTFSDLLDDAAAWGVDISEPREIVDSVSEMIKAFSPIGGTILAASPAANWEDHERKDLLARIEPALRSLSEMLAKISLHLDRAHKQSGLSDQFLAVSDEINCCLDLLWPGRLARSRGRPYVANDHLGPSFGLTALEPARIVSRIWQDTTVRRAPDSFVMTSATLEVPGENTNYLHFLRQLGVIAEKSGHYQDVNVNTDLGTSYFHEDFGRMSFVFPHPSVATPFDPTDDETVEVQPRSEWLQKFIPDLIETAASTGGVYVHCVSHADKDSIAATLRPRLSGRLIVHDKQTPLPVQQWDDLRKEGITPVLLSSSQEGFNLTGIKNVVITRLPFRPPAAMVDELIRHQAPTGDKSFVARFRNFTHNREVGACVSRLYQIICRGIRQPLDESGQPNEVTVWFGDARIPLPEYDRYPQYRPQGRPYMSRMLNAIPVRFRDSWDETLTQFRCFPEEANAAYINVVALPVAKPKGRRKRAK